MVIGRFGEVRQRVEMQPELGAAETEEFMSVAAHDLRNPIAVVRASAQMAQRQIKRGDSEGAQGRLAAIVDQTDRLSDMLETFLDAARIGSGRLSLRPDRVDLRELVDDAADRARSLRLGGEHGDRDLDCTIPDGCVGRWDRPRMTRAVRALLANALLYGDPSLPVHIAAHREDGRVRLII